MREFRTSGSEGGWASNGPVYPTKAYAGNKTEFYSFLPPWD